jgi:hypothetical protein
VSFILKGHGQPSDPGFDKAAGRPPLAVISPPAHQPVSQP